MDLIDLFKNSESPSVSLTHEQVDANWTSIESKINALISDVDKVVEKRNLDIIIYGNGSIEVDPKNLQPAGEDGQIFVGSESGLPSFQDWDARGEYVPLAAAHNISTKPTILNPVVKKSNNHKNGESSPDIFYKFAHLDVVDGNRVKSIQGGEYAGEIGMLRQNSKWEKEPNITQIFVDFSRFNTGDRVCFISDTKNGNLFPNRVCYIRRHITGVPEGEETFWASLHYTKEGALTNTETIQLDGGISFNNNAFISGEIAQCSGVPGGHLFYRPVFQGFEHQRYHPSVFLLVFQKKVEGNFVFLGSGRRSLYVMHAQYNKSGSDVDAVVAFWDRDRGIPIIPSPNLHENAIQYRAYMQSHGSASLHDEINNAHDKDEIFTVVAVESSNQHVVFVATQNDPGETGVVNWSILPGREEEYGLIRNTSMPIDFEECESSNPPKFLSFRVLKYS